MRLAQQRKRHYCGFPLFPIKKCIYFFSLMFSCIPKLVPNRITLYPFQNVTNPNSYLLTIHFFVIQNTFFRGSVIIQNELQYCKLLQHPYDLSVVNTLYNIYIPIKTATNNESTARKHLYDTMWTNTGCPIIVIFLALPIMFGKTKPWHFALFMKILLKMAQHTALHFCNHFL